MTIELNLQTILFAVGILWALYQGICYLADRYGLGKKRQEARMFREANMCLMREVIRWNYREYVMGKGVIDTDDLAHIEQVFEVYQSLGGNGSAKRQVEELRQLPKV